MLLNSAVLLNGVLFVPGFCPWVLRQSGEVGERNRCIQAIEFETGRPLKSGEGSPTLLSFRR